MLQPHGQSMGGWVARRVAGLVAWPNALGLHVRGQRVRGWVGALVSGLAGYWLRVWVGVAELHAHGH